MLWQYMPKKDACITAITSMSCLTSTISRRFPNRATYHIEIYESPAFCRTGNSVNRNIQVAEGKEINNDSNIIRDSVSSGERKQKSLNFIVR